MQSIFSDPNPVDLPVTSSRNATFQRRRLAALTGAVLAFALTMPMLSAGFDALRRTEYVLVEPAAASEAPAAPVVVEAPRPADCQPDPSTPVPLMVALIWRCRLLEAGVTPADANYIVAEAVVVAQCESRFDPGAVVFDGRYVNSPHPRTGLHYTAAGVFQFIRRSAARWIAGGYTAVHDPVANIHGAVSYFLHERSVGRRGWEPWECPAVNGDFKAHSVLPGWPGGPAALPRWATQL